MTTSAPDSAAPNPRIPGMGPSVFLLACFFAQLALVAGYGHWRPARMNISGADPIAYYAYFHSLYFDRDLDLANQYRSLGGEHFPSQTTATGKVGNHSAIGPAIAVAPFWIAADIVARLGGWEADGSSKPYHVAGFAGLAFYGLAALLLMALWLTRRFPPWIAAMAAAIVWGATSLAYYSFPTTFMPHAIGAAASALFLLAADRAPSRRAVALAGAALGVAMLMRWQNALWAALPAIQALIRLRESDDKNGALRREALHGVLFALFALLAFLPQMAAWHVIFGTPALIPQGEGYVFHRRPEILKTLFSTHNGLFTWTPAALVGAIGLLAPGRGRRGAAIGLAVVFLAQLLLNSILLDWHGSWSFSSRRFTELTPVFAFGWAGLFAWRPGRAWRKALCGAGALFVVWNEAFLFQYYFHLIAWDRPLTFHELVTDKFHLPTSYQRRLLHDNARHYAQRGDPARALELIQVAIEIDPHHDDVFETAGLIHAQTGHFAAATIHLQRALELRPGDPRITENLNWAKEELARRIGLAPSPPGPAPPAPEAK